MRDFMTERQGGRGRRDGEWGRGRGPGFGGPPWGRGTGRMRRGSIRTAILAVLQDGAGHGYELIQRLEEKTGGAWRPSPGSVYPTLQQLEDEGLVTAVERDGKRVYEITDAGRAAATERLEDEGGAPWEHAARGGELREVMMQLHLAVKQVGSAGNDDQHERAATVLRDARKALYKILAED